MSSSSMIRFYYGGCCATCGKSASIYDVGVDAREIVSANQGACSGIDAAPGSGSLLYRFMSGGLSAIEAAGSGPNAYYLATGHFHRCVGFDRHRPGGGRYRYPLHPAWALDTAFSDAVRRIGPDDIRHSHHSPHEGPIGPQAPRGTT